MTPEIQKIHEQNVRKLEAEARDLRHKQSLEQSKQIEQTVIKAFGVLMKYLEGTTTKTEVVNQLTEIGTPDVQQVTEAVDRVNETIQGKDFSELAGFMQLLLDELKQIPKEKVEIPEFPNRINVDNLNALEKYFSRLEDAVNGVAEKEIKAPDVNVEAPSVNVEAPVVNVDVDAVKSNLREVVDAVKSIVIPKPIKTDTSKIERRLDKSNKYLKEIAEKPVGGGGGGGHTTPYIDSQGKPVYVEISLDLQVDDDGTYTYLGNATPGTATSEASWRIKRVVNASGVITHADGSSQFNKEWDERASYSY